MFTTNYLLNRMIYLSIIAIFYGMLSTQYTHAQEQEQAIITGTVYFDEDRNGVFDTDDIPFPGIDIMASVANLEDGEPITFTTTTNEMGEYRFVVDKYRMPENIYNLRYELFPIDLEQISDVSPVRVRAVEREPVTMPRLGSIWYQIEQPYQVDFPFISVASAASYGRVYHDVDDNELYDETIDIPFPDVEIQIDVDRGSFEWYGPAFPTNIYTVTTDENGYYSLPISETVIGDGLIKSTTLPYPDGYYTLVDKDDSILPRDLRLQSFDDVNMHDVTGQVFIDANANGIYDPLVDTPMSGVEIEVDDMPYTIYTGGSFTGTPFTLYTDENGYYTISHIIEDTDSFTIRYKSSVPDNLYLLNVYQYQRDNHIPAGNYHTDKNPADFILLDKEENPEYMGRVKGMVYFEDRSDGYHSYYDDFSPEDENDYTLENITLYIKSESHRLYPELIMTTTTNANGEYFFDNLPFGIPDEDGRITSYPFYYIYVVEDSLPEGMKLGYHDYSVFELDTEIEMTTPDISVVTLNDWVVFEPNHVVADLIYYDNNKNEQFDPDEGETVVERMWLNYSINNSGEDSTFVENGVLTVGFDDLTYYSSEYEDQFFMFWIRDYDLESMENVENIHFPKVVKLTSNEPQSMSDTLYDYLATGINPELVPPTSQPSLSTDPSCDGAWTLTDAILIKRYDVFLLPTNSTCEDNNGTKFSASRCDINNDNKCGVVDAVIIQQCNVFIDNGYCSAMQSVE